LSAAAVIAAIGARVFLRGIVLAKVLRSRGVRFRLALLRFSVGLAISVQLSFAVSFLSGSVVPVHEVRMHRFFVRNSLLCGVIRA